MSYSTVNTLPPKTRMDDIRDFLNILNYKRCGRINDDELGKFQFYSYFDETDYKSWAEIEASICLTPSGRIQVSTRTPMGRSFHDLDQQNNTATKLHKYFGGKFVTDAGKGKCWRPKGKSPAPAESGCLLAFDRFGRNLGWVMACRNLMEFPSRQLGPQKPGIYSSGDPRYIANSSLIPFLVAILEDYFKSTFIALFKYSSKQEAFLKQIRLQGDQLFQITNRTSTIEDQIARSISFQRISAICNHFKNLDAKLDIAGILRKPYHKRSEPLFDFIEKLVSARHKIIHGAEIDYSITDERLRVIMMDLEEVITRVYRQITHLYGWHYSKEWTLPKNRKKQ